MRATEDDAGGIARRRGRRNLAALGVVAVAAIGLAAFAPPDEVVEVNVSPLASLSLGSRATSGRVVPGAEIERCLPEVLADGTLDTLYMADVPAVDDAPIVTMRWPRPMALRRLAVLGGGSDLSGTLVIEAGGQKLTLRRDPGKPGEPAFGEWIYRAPVDVLTVRLVGREPGRDVVSINAIAVMAAMPRWQAWAYVLGLNVVGPWAAGAAFALATLGWGAILARGGGPGRRIVVGVLAMGVLGAAWCVAPRGAAADGAYIVALGIGAAWAIARGPLSGEVADRRLLGLVAAAAAILLIDVFSDTYLVMNRRMQPVDYLHSYIGGQLLAAGAPMVEPLPYRPWLLHATFAPLTVPLGRFGYWGYAGVLAWLNALALVPIALLARDLGRGDGLRAAGLVALLPLLGAFNACGQRPLAGALCLLAIRDWTARRPVWGGLALTVAIAIHPGSLFLLPPAFLVLWWRAEMRFAIKAVAMPGLAYLAWSLAINAAYPDLHNILVFHPLMASYQVRFPPGARLWEAAASLTAADWRQLLWNRAGHLRHYLWTDNWSEPTVDALRWVSLTSTLGVVWTLSLLRREAWRGRGEFVALAVVGPLIVHHLHVGLPHALFHVSPTPFLALAFLAVSAPPLPAWATALAWSELFARRLFPLAIVLFLPGKRGDVPLSRFGLLGDDRLSCLSLACLAPVAWLCLAAWLGPRSGVGADVPRD